MPITRGSYYEVPPVLDATGEITLRDLVKFVRRSLDFDTTQPWDLPPRLAVPLGAVEMNCLGG